MRTKNAKRLWPVPVTLGVMALAALLAFGLLATTGAQPAAAQDDPDCTVGLGADASPEPLADGELDCPVHAAPAVIALPGHSLAGDDNEVTVWVYAQDGSIEGGTALTDVWDHDAIAGDAGATPVVPTPRAARFSAIMLEIPAASQGLGGGGLTRSTATISVTPASGKSDVTLYIFYADDPPIPEADYNHDGDTGADATDDVKQINVPSVSANDTSGTMKVTFLGAPSLYRPDTEVQTDSNNDGAIDSNDDDATDTNMDGHVDNDDKRDPASDLYVVFGQLDSDGALEDASSPPVNSGFNSKSPYAIEAAPGVFVTAIMRDVYGNLLEDTGDNKAQSRVTFTISYADGSALDSNPITPDTVAVNAMGIARTQLDHWASSGAVSATVTAMYSGPTGDLDLGEVKVVRGGDPAVIKGATFNMACLDDADPATPEDYMDDTIDLDNEDCAMQTRFRAGDRVVVKSHLEDSLDTVVDGNLAVSIDDEMDNPLDTDGSDTVASPVPGAPARAWVYVVDEDAMLGGHMITLTSSEDDVEDLVLTVTVAGEPVSYEFDNPAMYIPLALGSSQMFTLMAMDANGNVPDFTDADPAEIVVLGVEGSYVTGRDGNNAKFDAETGQATFTIFAPVGATQGQTVLIQVRVDGAVVASHTVMFGEAPMMPGMPMNVAPMAGDDVEDQMVYVGAMVEVQSNFSDPDEDMLSYMASSSDDMIATATVDDMGMVTITGVAEGMATITVTATDADGSGMSAMQEIMVTVSDTPPATTAPMGADHSVLGNSITVAWDPNSAQNTKLIKVALFNADVTALAGIDAPVKAFNLAAGDPGAHTFNNVPAGTYKVVVAAVDSEGDHVVSVVPDAVTIN